MCVSPLKILNRSKVQVAGLTPEYYHVPCGKCWQCQQKKRDGFTVRSIFEFMQAKQLGGFTLFLTLTYNNDYLHVFQGVPLFNKEDVQKYLKRVRINIFRDLEKRYSKEDARKIVCNHIKYFCTSENGDKRHRPHYHILFFVETPLINRWRFRNIAINTWYCGFCVPSRENFGFVTDPRGIKYCAKYVGKSMIDNEYFSNCFKVYESRYNKYITDYESKNGFLKHGLVNEKDIPVMRDYLSRISRLIDFNKSIMDKLRNNSPFLLVSKGLGRFAYDNTCSKQYRLTSEMFVNGKIFCPDNQSGVKEYIMPDYYKRKSFYNVHVEVLNKVRHVTFKLNQFGIDIKTKCFENYFKNYDNNIQRLLSHGVSLDILKHEYCKDLGIKSVSSLCTWLSSQLSNPEWKEFALLYSHYSQYLTDDELIRDVPSADISPIDVYNFRQYVGSDTHTSIDYDTVNDYHDFYVDILFRIHEIVFKNPLFPSCLNMLELIQEDYNRYLTSQRYVSDKCYSDNRKLFS